MDYAKAYSQIKTGKIQHIYLISGQERYMAYELQKAIITALTGSDEGYSGLTIFQDDPDVEDMVHLLESVPFIADKNVVVVQDTKLFKAKSDGQEQGKLIRVLENMPEYSYLIWMTKENADKRRKLYKLVEKFGAIIEVNSLKLNEARQWLYGYLESAAIKMKPDAMDYLINILSIMPAISLGFVVNELEKLFLYIYPEETISSDAVKTMLAKVPEVSVFAMLEALSEKNVGKALSLLDEQLRDGQHPLIIVSMLAYQVRRLLQTKEMAGKGLPNAELSRRLKVPLFVVDKLIKQSRGFALPRLKQAMIELTKANSEIKFSSSGTVSLEKIIISICK